MFRFAKIRMSNVSVFEFDFLRSKLSSHLKFLLFAEILKVEIDELEYAI